MTTRKRRKRTQLEQFLAALSAHEDRENAREAARESRIIDQMRALVEKNLGELRAIVDKVTGYQTAVARAWDGENKRLASIEAKQTDHEQRIAALEARDGTGTEK